MPVDRHDVAVALLDAFEAHGDRRMDARADGVRSSRGRGSGSGVAKRFLADGGRADLADDGSRQRAVRVAAACQGDGRLVPVDRARRLRRRWHVRHRAVTGSSLAVAVAWSAAAACSPRPATPGAVAGHAAARRRDADATPREVNLIAKDYSFLPAVLDLVPGETIAPARRQRRPRGPRGGHRRRRRPGRLGGRGGGHRRRPARPDAAGRPCRRTSPGMRVVVRSGRARRRPLDGPDRRPRLGAGDRPADPAAGSSAATSPATGPRACGSRSAGSSTGRP